jgi:spore germination protein YaaH
MNFSRFQKKNIIVVALVFSSSIFSVYAATFDTAAWIPYWRKSDGASSTLTNIKKLTQISPFAYELQDDGSIKNSLKIEEDPWPSLIAEAKKNNVKVYPSILSYPNTASGKKAVLTLLSNKKKRQAHVAEIRKLVKDNSKKE